LEVRGSLHAELAGEGQTIALKQADGELALRYSGLHAYDARGRVLPARMKVSKARVILEVNDAGAVYPVTIDPTFTQQTRLGPPYFNVVGNQWDYTIGGERFGESVAISGDTAVVGAPGDDTTAWDQGSAYVFVRSGATWSMQQRLLAQDAAANDHFGYSVAISGETVVVGAPGDNSLAGSAYVFVRNGTSWTQQQKLGMPGGAGGERFGYSVALSGETVVVGAPYSNAAQIWTRSNGVWNKNQDLKANWTLNAGVAAAFGHSVAISGSVVVVGDPFQIVDSRPSQGAAYVFVLDLTLGTSTQHRLTASDGAAGDLFGWSVALSGSRLVVGAPLGDASGCATCNTGAAYVFARNGGTTWSPEQKLIANDGASGDWFGRSVAISGSTVAVGAPYDDVFLNNVMQDAQGSVYIFTRAPNTTTWSQQPKLNASGQFSNLAHDQDNFGSAVALGSGTVTTLVVGAPNDFVAYGWPPWFVARVGSAFVFVM
jgi:hypothetical protein